jgi:hypothetical protein
MPSTWRAHSDSTYSGSITLRAYMNRDGANVTKQEHTCSEVIRGALPFSD